MEMAQKMLQQAVFQNLKPMMIAQVQSAMGEQFMYRKDVDEKGNEKTVLVTDPDEIGRALDSLSRGDEKYYFIMTKAPNTQAFKELLDRGFGKAKEIHDVNLNVQLSLSDLAKRALEGNKKVTDLPIQNIVSLPPTS